MIIIKNVCAESQHQSEKIYSIWSIEYDGLHHREDGKILFSDDHCFMYLDNEIEYLSGINFKLKNTLDII